MPLTPVRVVPRRAKDGTAELFFLQGEGLRRELMAYAHVGQHSGASREYFLDCTSPVDATETDVAALIREWDNLGPSCPFIVCKRLHWHD